MANKLITEFPTKPVFDTTPIETWPDSLLDADAVRGAIHTIFAGEFSSEAQERGHRLPCGQEMSLDTWAPRQADHLVLPYAWYLLGRVEQAWGYSVGLVFHHAGITDDEQEHALTDLFLGLQGHGVNLSDDFAEGLEKAASVLLKWQRDPNSQVTGPTDFDPAPFCDEMNSMRYLARAVWDTVDGPTVHYSEASGPICGGEGATMESADYVSCPECLKQCRGIKTT
jgi:hypothetical protein